MVCPWLARIRQVRRILDGEKLKDELGRPIKSSGVTLRAERHWQHAPQPNAASCHCVPTPGPDRIRRLPDRSILDTAFEECAHERQVVMAIKNFSAAVSLAVSRDEFDAVLAFDRFSHHLPILPAANRA
jgi:hypothetical protein